MTARMTAAGLEIPELRITAESVSKSKPVGHLAAEHAPTHHLDDLTQLALSPTEAGLSIRIS